MRDPPPFARLDAVTVDLQFGQFARLARNRGQMPGKSSLPLGVPPIPLWQFQIADDRVFLSETLPYSRLHASICLSPAGTDFDCGRMDTSRGCQTIPISRR